MSKENNAAHSDQSENKKTEIPKGGIRKVWEIVSELAKAQMDLNERIDFLEQIEEDKVIPKMKTKSPDHSGN